MLTLEQRPSSQDIDRAMLCRGHEPRAGISWNARLGPLFERSDERVVREIFSQPDITDDAREAGDEARRLDSPDGVDRAIGIGHVSPIITFRSRVIRRGHMKRKGSAVWRGGLKDGQGTVSTDSGVLSNTQYSFSTRFEDGKGTNPEELIAAAHAGCFSMALSAQLGNAGITAEQIQTTATVSLDKTDGGFSITAVHLDVRAKIPGADKQAFETAANNAKSGCPVSRVLNATITMDAELEG